LRNPLIACRITRGVVLNWKAFPVDWTARFDTHPKYQRTTPTRLPGRNRTGTPPASSPKPPRNRNRATCGHREETARRSSITRPNWRCSAWGTASSQIPRMSLCRSSTGSVLSLWSPFGARDLTHHTLIAGLDEVTIYPQVLSGAEIREHLDEREQRLARLHWRRPAIRAAVSDCLSQASPIEHGEASAGLVAKTFDELPGVSFSTGMLRKFPRPAQRVACTWRKLLRAPRHRSSRSQ
jgi:hypothetical protein